MMLLRIALRVGGALTALVLLTVAGLHLRPYRYVDGFATLLPDPACEPACVLGVQLGVHHRDEAVALLEAHPMVGSIRQGEYGDGTGEIRWRWADAYEALHSHSSNSLWYDADGIVQQATLPTAVPLMDYRLRLGLPDATQLTDYPGSNHVAVHEVYGNVHLSYGYLCIPIGAPVLHRQPVTVLVNPPRQGTAYEVTRPMDSLLYMKPCG